MSKRARPRSKIAVLGAGNMGTALAHVLARNGHEVTMWDFFPKVVEDIQIHRENRRFLPGIALPRQIHATNSPTDCVTGAALVAICVPSLFANATLEGVLPALNRGAILLNVAKGFAPGTRQPLPFLLERLAPGHSCVHLAGPAIADEFVRGQTASVVFASSSESSVRRVTGWFAGPAIVALHTPDVAGAVIGGILKNVYAILLGSLSELGGDSRNLEAAALTASLREMVAIATAHGGQSETLHGLAGLGDLVGTGFSRASHNRCFGQMLATGATAAAIEEEKGCLPEGVRAATAACALARESGVKAPLANWVRRAIGGTRPTLDNLQRAMRAAAHTP